MRTNSYNFGASGYEKLFSMFRISLTLLILSFPTFGYSQEKTVYNSWSSNTALLMPAGKWESGLFHPLHYGLNKKLELRSNAIIFPLLPNAGLKVSQGKIMGFDVASEHDLSYPTLFLNIASAKGVGGMISPQFSFPFLLSFTNSLILSKPVGRSALLAADLGLAFAIRGSKPDYIATIDMPLVYPRMAHYYEGVSIRAGVTYKGKLAKKLFFEENARIFLITRERENLFVENYGTILWATSGSVRLRFGYVLSWGKYPFGNLTQLWPVIDILFGSISK
jgi:hypothetical protein